MSTSSRPIPLRQLDFDFDPSVVPRDWLGSDPFLFTFCDSLSVLFPEGERFFIDSVKRLRDLADTPDLRDQIAGFIGQEAIHGREHRAFNDLLVEHGYASARSAESRVRRLLDRGRRHLSPATQLAITCALEHFTALMAEGILREPGLREEMHPAVRPLWVWHALEESEHKAVAFDLYRASGGSERRRILVMLRVTVLFVLVVSMTHARFLAERGILLKPWRWLSGATRLWLWPGHFARLLPGYLAYFRPGFHPNDRDTTALLDEWRERLFGAAGQLRGELRANGAQVA